MIDPSWEQLDNLQCAEFKKAVFDADFAALFQGQSYQLWRKELRFLDGFSHYALVNRDVMPYFVLDYISNGDDFYYLDGSEHPLELLANRGVLRLSERNVLDYLVFFSDVAFYPYRKIKFIIDPSKSPYSGASAMGHHFRVEKYAQKIAISANDDGSHALTLPVLYNGDTAKGQVFVKADGEIHLLSPVKVQLMDRTRAHERLHYSHPYEKDVLGQNLEILQHSESGTALIAHYRERKDTLRILSGMRHSFYVPRGGLGYVIAPQNIDAYSPYQLIDIICALKDLELRHEGFYRANSDDDLHDYIAANASYHLEIIYTLCRIIEELEQSDFTDIAIKFRRAGYEKFYSAYKNGILKDDMYALILSDVYEDKDDET